MCFAQSDHTFQLPGGSSNPLLLSTRIHTGFAHLDVGLDKRFGSSFCKNRVNLGASIRNIGRQGLKRLHNMLAEIDSDFEVKKTHNDIVGRLILHVG